MIFLLCTEKNRFPIDRYLSSWGFFYFRWIQPVTYEYFLTQQQQIPGVYIFADIELLSDQQRRQAVVAWEKMQGRNKDFVLLNHPERSLRRYNLLKLLHAQGINSFRAYRPQEDLRGLKFPAYLRIENDHEGSRTSILNDQKELEENLHDLEIKHKEKEDWLITEFCDTRDTKGIFRKYSAFMLNGHIVPRHLFFSRTWFQKEEDLVEPSQVEEEQSYLRNNPHREELIKIFNSAGIDYGRIDYGMKEGKIQVWEINTNPMSLTAVSTRSSSRVKVHKIFNQNFSVAWKTLIVKSQAQLWKNYPHARKQALMCFWKERVEDTPAFKKWDNAITFIKICIVRVLRVLRIWPQAPR